MESSAAAENNRAEAFHFEDGGNNIEAATEAQQASGATATVTMGENFPADTRVIVTSSGEHFSLSSAKGIDLLGEEFVAKLKAEPGSSGEMRQSEPQARTRVVMAVSGAETTPAGHQTTMTATQEAANGSLVYCNLNDLDLVDSTNGGGGESYSFASLHSLADASSAAQQQAEKWCFSTNVFKSLEIIARFMFFCNFYETTCHITIAQDWEILDVTCVKPVFWIREKF
jgi:hypothetical protein